jgi:hypothetical protein
VDRCVAPVDRNGITILAEFLLWAESSKNSFKLALASKVVAVLPIVSINKYRAKPLVKQEALRVVLELCLT